MAGGTRKPLERVSAFWDTSALVPLCVRQPATAAAIALYEQHQLVVWWTAPVEMASALARLRRMQQIDNTSYAEAQKLAAILTEACMVIQPSHAVRERAIELVQRYDLRAADSLQLAAALAWCEDAPQGRIFLSIDEKLRQAALLSGFEAKQM